MSVRVVQSSRHAAMFVFPAGIVIMPVVFALSVLAQGGCTRVKRLFEGNRVLTPMEVFQKVSPSVFVVEALDEDGKPLMLGSAVALASDLLITNCHVVRNGSSLRVRRGQKKWTALLITAMPERDLCALRPAGVILSPVQVRSSSELSTGEHVYAVGSPEGLELTFSEGVISALRDTEGVRIIQTSAPISPGSSGGGLFDGRAALVGITTFQLKEGQSLNFAMPGEWISAGVSDSVGNDRHSSQGRTDAQLESKSWLAIGLDAVKNEDYDLAVHAFKQCRELKEAEASRAWFGLGEIAAKGTYLDSQSDAFKGWFRKYAWSPGEPDRRAIASFEKAIEAKSDYAEAWRELGRMHFRSNEYAEAVEAEKEATRLDSKDKTAWLLLGAMYWKRKSYSEAVSALQQGLQATPNDATLLQFLGMVYAEKNDRQGTVDVYDQLKRVDPKLAQDYFRTYVLPHSEDQHR